MTRISSKGGKEDNRENRISDTRLRNKLYLVENGERLMADEFNMSYQAAHEIFVFHFRDAIDRYASLACFSIARIV